MPEQEVSGSSLVSTPKLNASQFVVGSGNTIQLSAASLGLSVGMTLTGTRTTSSGGYTGAGTTDLNAGALLTVW